MVKVAEIIENPTAIIKHPNNTNNIFINILPNSTGKYETTFTPKSIIGPTPKTQYDKYYYMSIHK